MALKHYDTVVNGTPTTLRLSDAEAKRRGLTARTKRAEPPANKTRAAQADKGADQPSGLITSRTAPKG